MLNHSIPQDFGMIRYTLDLAKSGSVRFSPIINPFMLSFGGSNGLSYRQDFKYTALLSRDRLLRIAPKVGYNFKRKEVASMAPSNNPIQTADIPITVLK